MSEKSVNLSVRLSEEDARFLRSLSMPDATNVSEKLRHIIGRARQREAGRHSYPAALKLVDQLLDPVRQQLLDFERRERVHSELLARVYEWLPDMLGYLLAGLDQEPDSDEMLDLAELESGIADRAFRLTEAVLRLALTEPNPCYEDDAISRRLPATLGLAKLLMMEKQTKGGQ
ncbi:MAG: hypothetical protein AAGA23_05520 [Pseudomonadota bacterium]